MGKPIIKTDEKTKKLKDMVENDDYTSGDMIDLIMIEREFPSIDPSTIEYIEANKSLETAQHEQLHVIRDIQTAKQKAQKNAASLSEASTEYIQNPNLKAVEMHVGSEPVAPTRAKTQDDEHENGHEH